jgi:hypothetical protein
VKSYIYRSQPKIDLLWEQLNSKKIEKYSAELKLNFGVVSGSIKSHPLEETLHARLEVVLEHLKRERQIGGLAEPSTFVRGVLPMTWQELGVRRDEDAPKMVLFSGRHDQPQLLVALVGSVAHVSGMSGLEPATFSYIQPSFWNRIVETLASPRDDELRNEVRNLRYEMEWHDTVPQEVRVEFVAKTYFSRDGFFVGSPLYVAEAPIGVIDS